MSIFTNTAAILTVALLPTAGLADFTGAYAGAGISSITGDIELPTEDLFGFDIDLGIKEDTIFTGFGGYQIQRRDIVYGGEIAVSRVKDGGIAGIGFEGLDTTAIDIKGRVGYVLNEKVMAYGTAGFSRLDIDLETFGVDDPLEADGFIVGAGIDYLATDNVVLGAEFTNRQVEGSIDVSDDLDVDLSINSFTVRAAFKF